MNVPTNTIIFYFNDYQKHVVVLVTALHVVPMFGRRDRERCENNEDRPPKDSGANADSGTVTYAIVNPVYDIHDIATGRNIPEPNSTGDNGINHQVNVEMPDLNGDADGISLGGGKLPVAGSDDMSVVQVNGVADQSNSEPYPSRSAESTPASAVEWETPVSEKADDSGGVSQSDPINEDGVAQDFVTESNNSEVGNGDTTGQNMSSGDASHQTHSLA